MSAADPYTPRHVLAPDAEAEALAKQIAAIAKGSGALNSRDTSAVASSHEPQTEEEAAASIVATYRGAVRR